jgi:CSLREA domain-containing protein
MSSGAFRQVMSKGLIGGVFLSFAVLIMLVALPVITAQAATITVNTKVDENNSDGDCSLREAILSANNDVSKDGCTAGGAGVDTVRVPAGTYNLTIPPGATDRTTDGDIDIGADMIIQGGGAGVTIISGGEAFGDRIFEIKPGATVTINDLTVTGGAGSQGGAILNRGTLRLNRVAVNNNTATNAGGIMNLGGSMLTIRNSTISNNTATNDAGGIQNGINFNSADLVIVNSTISGNTAAGDAGAINNRGRLILNNVTITDNTATNDRAGGIFNHTAY